MATGPQHYQTAEKIVANLGDLDYVEVEQLGRIGVALTRAVLALAAATAISENGAMPNVDYEEWETVAGTGGPLPRNTGLVWWLDDGGESPEPELYASYHDASRAGLKQWRDANPTTTIRMQGWLEAEDNGTPPDVQLGDMELVINDHHTGIFVRCRRPKTAPDETAGA